MRQGAKGYLGKPVAEVDLIVAIDTLLSQEEEKDDES
jgi:FixJ family two-component response regulator